LHSLIGQSFFLLKKKGRQKLSPKYLVDLLTASKLKAEMENKVIHYNDF